MIKKLETLKRIIDVGVVAVVRCNNKEQAIKTSEACIKGGIPAIEVTFTVPNAHLVLQNLRENFSKEELIIGAGTVLDSETARIAILHGAEYIVSPGFDLKTAKLCNRYGVPYMAGCMTITEVITALESGVDIIKLFPGSNFSPSIVKDIKAPLPQTPIMPTGGVSLDNVQQWIENGCVAVGIGSALNKPADNGDYDKVSELAAQFVQAVKVARK
ncbi:bifunctional 2-keto-4-hydroxyglutarate aldolase/2-keto-3-deoxy-6-phosphogluconate aldolase [Clostridium tarantellae]|uniref:Bifunctional 4-hydroxy-2-oxoglutarate aldolase/2-dehydro-3-deoxy-phosphogluconate aldolase n=1 Tax=Clostridium tarantellae TaxID=39493 RepID=A0A6I1MT89_9CLOT|nr:bifunctional 2-keto-4-hydroxyglutarate aldolase/2-keto-3-deoxy-6-phosphogluconate aldolase [Clostridium tarantellae]MPQ44081.1 bifunctional 4-hydroxy-2-oxoglutarate aldolase/2-dehydro-3-deoxy-phosphogluconate aldolase [Clostridium tarantellae]